MVGRNSVLSKVRLHHSKALWNRALIVVLLSVLTAVKGYSQQIFVLSAEDDRPVPGAQISFKSLSNDSIVQRLTTDRNGTVNVPHHDKGVRYSVTVRFYGYNTYNDTLGLNKEKQFIYLKPSSQQFDEVVVTAQYKKQKADQSIHEVKVIDARQIENMAAQNLKDALSNTLNVRLSEDNILGSRMELQGIGGQNIKILIDGVPMTGRLDGNIDLSQIPMENVDRIEIIEGPLSVQYGTDALGGTINIITKKSTAAKWSVLSKNYYESNGRFNNTGQLRWGNGTHQVVIDGGRYFFDGWSPDHPNFFYDRDPIADSSRVMSWNPKEQYFVNLNYRLQKEKWFLNYSSNNFTEEVINRGSPRPPYLQSAFDDYYETDRINQRIQGNYVSAGHSSFNFIAAYNGFFRQKNTFLRDLTTIEDVLSPAPSDHDTSTFHTLLSRGNWTYVNDSSKVQFKIGYDVNYDIGRGKRIASGEQTIIDAALFGSLEYRPVDQLVFRPGLRWSYNSSYPAPLVPSFHSKWKIFQREKQQLYLRASYARGFRSPSIKELHFYFVDINHNIQGNEDLQAEQSNNFNMAFSHSTRLSKGQWKNKLSVFYNDIENRITLAQQNQTLFSYFNLERYKTTGVQLQSTFKRKKLTAQIGAGYVGRQNQLANFNPENFNFLFSPQVQGSFQYTIQPIGLHTNVFYKYTGTLPTIRQGEDGQLQEGEIADYHMLDATLSRSFLEKRLQLSIGIKNALNVRSVISSGESTGAHAAGTGQVQVGTGRTFFARCIVEIKSKNNE